MRRYKYFSAAVNKLKGLHNSIGASPVYRDLFSTHVLQELFRISHRQFQWQQKPNSDDLIRYFKIFGRPDLNAILIRELGMSAQQLYSLGLALTGVYLETLGVRDPVRVELEDIVTQQEADRFIRLFAIELDELKAKMIEVQSYDQDFAYTMNPLLITPLVWVNLNGNRTLIAPIPSYILKRFTEGIYYEIYNAAGFSTAFGDSFQDYVGEVLTATTLNSNINVLGEENYHVGKNQKHSIDWIAEDDTATVFVECKTKRVRYAGKLSLVDTTILDEDLGKMADFIVQAYKTLTDALAGRYMHWQSAGRPIYVMIVILEEWYFFGDRMHAYIDEQVRTKFAEAGLALEMLERYQYSICSAEDLEYSSSVMAQVGIQSYMELKHDEEHRYWSYGSFTSSHFYQEMINRPDLFPIAMQEINPNL